MLVGERTCEAHTTECAYTTTYALELNHRPQHGAKTGGH